MKASYFQSRFILLIEITNSNTSHPLFKMMRHKMFLKLKQRRTHQFKINFLLHSCVYERTYSLNSAFFKSKFIMIIKELDLIQIRINFKT
jgi:hypothetical protein